MAICRDCFGKLSYTAVNKRKQVFSVTRDKGGHNMIIRHDPYKRTSEVFFNPYNTPGFLGWELGAWDSFIMAVDFLKKHKDYLF